MKNLGWYFIKVQAQSKNRQKRVQHLNKALRSECFQFNSYSVVYGEGIKKFFVIDGDETKKYELFIESFENEEEAQTKALNLNEINRKSDYN